MDVVDWLLDSDPSIRWQVIRDLTDEDQDMVAAERSRVATEGWGARLLALQEPEGQWDGGTYQPGWADPYVYVPAWTSTTYTLFFCGPWSRSRRASRLNTQSHWFGTTASGSTMARTSSMGKSSRASTAWPWRWAPISVRMWRGIVERLLGDQMADGGWNCEQENGSTRGSFHTTISVLEGLLEYETATDAPAEVDGGPPPRRGVSPRASASGDVFLMAR